MQSVSAEVVPALTLGGISTSGAWSRDVRHGPDIWGKASELHICAEVEAWSGSCHALSTACSMCCRSHYMTHLQNSSTACCSTSAGGMAYAQLRMPAQVAIAPVHLLVHAAQLVPDVDTACHVPCCDPVSLGIQRYTLRRAGMMWPSAWSECCCDLPGMAQHERQERLAN